MWWKNKQKNKYSKYIFFYETTAKTHIYTMVLWYSPTVLKQWMFRLAGFRLPTWISSRLWSELLVSMTCTATILGWYRHGCLGKWYFAERPFPVMWWSNSWVLMGPKDGVLTWQRKYKERVIRKTPDWRVQLIHWPLDYKNELKPSKGNENWFQKKKQNVICIS